MTDHWTSSEPAIFDRIDAVLDDGKEAVLATVVDVEGNAYRRPGAKMVVDAGEGHGSITAGCLEDEVLDLAERVLESGRPHLETFDLMEDDDVWGLGMGCHGIVDVLLEPIDSGLRPVVDAYLDGYPVTVLTVLDGFVGDEPASYRGVYRPGQGFGGEGEREPGGELFARLEPIAASAAADGASRTVEVDPADGTPVNATEGTPVDIADETSVDATAGTTTVFVDGVTPPPELVVVGAGPDVEPIVDLAARNGFRVRVVGYRGGQLDPDRFPTASAVHSTSPRSLLTCHDFDEETYVVVVTHNYVDDKLTVDALLDTPVPYVALVGARERTERLLTELHEERSGLDRSDAERIYAPAGLDLGGGSPHQIATSIVAEAMAVHNDRRPRHLRSRDGPIHERVDDSQNAST